MKYYFLGLIFCLSANAEVPETTLNHLQKLYPQKTKESLLEIIKNSKTPFKLWRAFPAYSFDIINRKFSKDISARSGFCAGDPHAENFGYLFSPKKSETIFTINDLDDSAPCKLDADLLRMLAGNLFLKSNQLSEQVNSYIKGLNGLAAEFEVVNELQVESLKKQTQLPKKYREIHSGICQGEFSELSEDEILLVKNYMETTKRKFNRACSRVKESGGSAGQKRYIIFFEKSESFSAIELKPLSLPAPLQSTTLSINDRNELYDSSVKIFLGEDYSDDYRAVLFNKQGHIERPLWAGNVGVDLKDFSDTNLTKLLLLELHVLGLHHRKSNTSSIDSKKLQILAQQLHREFKLEFGIP